MTDRILMTIGSSIARQPLMMELIRKPELQQSRIAQRGGARTEELVAAFPELKGRRRYCVAFGQHRLADPKADKLIWETKDTSTIPMRPSAAASLGAMLDGRRTLVLLLRVGFLILDSG